MSKSVSIAKVLVDGNRPVWFCLEESEHDREHSAVFFLMFKFGRACWYFCDRAFWACSSPQLKKEIQKHQALISTSHYLVHMPIPVPIQAKRFVL
jgi:hypothetical protein